jgi:hypothetical protein
MEKFIIMNICDATPKIIPNFFPFFSWYMKKTHLKKWIKKLKIKSIIIMMMRNY